jgi:hypothetical protein
MGWSFLRRQHDPSQPPPQTGYHDSGRCSEAAVFVPTQGKGYVLLLRTTKPTPAKAVPRRSREEGSGVGVVGMFGLKLML